MKEEASKKNEAQLEAKPTQKNNTSTQVNTITWLKIRDVNNTDNYTVKKKP